jgi:hypothetical protein
MTSTPDCSNCTHEIPGEGCHQNICCFESISKGVKYVQPPRRPSEERSREIEEIPEEPSAIPIEEQGEVKGTVLREARPDTPDDEETVPEKNNGCQHILLSGKRKGEKCGREVMDTNFFTSREDPHRFYCENHIERYRKGESEK